MNELVIRSVKENITSLELLELINKCREEEGNKTRLEHSDLLKMIRKEFKKQIGAGKISPTSYINSQIKNNQ